MRRQHSHRAAALTLCCLFTITACSDDGPATVTTSTTTTPSLGSSTAAPSTAVVSSGSTSEVSTPPAATSTAYLSAMRAAAQGSGDRVVFEFEGPVPGYRIGYADGPIVQDGSGDAVAVSGAAALQVRFNPASSVELTGGLRKTYTGPTRSTPPGMQKITEVVQVSDFEAYLVWAVGTRSKTPFSVSVLSAPSRVVIDFP